jgi:acyl carrier protein
MSEGSIWDTMLDIMRETFDDDDLEITRESTAQDVEGWDSLSHIELIVALEHAFGVQFRTGEIAGLRTVGELADLLTARARDAGR